MRVKNSWKRVIAGMLAVLVMAAAVPAGTDFGGYFGGTDIVASADTAEQSETFATNQGKNTYTGTNVTITADEKGDEDGMYLSTTKSATISVAAGYQITKVEFTKGAGDINSFSSAGKVTYSGNVATVSDVNAQSLTVKGSQLVQIAQVKVYYEPVSAEQSETFATNQSKNTYSGTIVTIKAKDKGDEDGMWLDSTNSATISVAEGYIITKAEFTRGAININSLRSSAGNVTVSGDVATVSDVNAQSLTVDSTDYLQIKQVKVYYEKTEWAIGDNINLNGKWFFYNDNDTIRVHGRNSSAVVPTPFYDESNSQWVFGNSISADQYSPEPSGIIYNNEHEAGLFIKKPSGKPSAVIPSGFKIKSGSGTQADPYSFELVYPIQTVSSNKPIVVKAGDDFKVDGSVSDVKIGNEDPYSISGGVASGTVFTVSEDTNGLSVAVNDIECSLPFSVNSAKTYLVYYYYGKLAFIENKVYNSELDSYDLNIGDVLAPGASFDSVGTFCFQEGNGSYQEYGYGVKFSVVAGGLKQGGTIKNNFADNKNAFVYDHVDSDNDKQYFNQTHVDLGPVVTTAPTAKENLKYNGNEQTLVNEGTAEGGTMEYGLGEPAEVIEKGEFYELSGDDLTVGKIFKPSDFNGFLFPENMKVKIDDTVFSPLTNISDEGYEACENHVNVYYSNSLVIWYRKDNSNKMYYLHNGYDALRIDKIDGDTIEVTAVKSSECFEVKTWSATPPKGTNAGSYTVFYKAVKDDKSSDVGSVTATIAKANATVTTAPTAKENLKYNGEPQDLVTAGTSDDGTVQYAVVETDDDTPDYNVVKYDSPDGLGLADAEVNTIYTPDLEGKYKGLKGIKFSSGNYIIDGITYTDIRLCYSTDLSKYYLMSNKGSIPLPEGCDGLLVTDIDSGNVYLEIVNTANPAGEVEIDEEAWVESIPKETDAGEYNVYYRVKGDANHNNTKPVKIENVKIGKANATVTVPAVTAVNETVSKKADGKITSVTDAMEYRKDGETTYTAVAENATEITDLEAGKYYVRYKSDNNHNASDETEVTINAGRKLIATFKNADGTTLQTVEVDYNAVPTFTGDTPTKAKTAQYTYTFKGWNKTITALTDDATYTATYTNTVNQYTVRFVNDDGTVLQSGKVAYGTVPKYTGKTPTKPATAQYTYTFKGWNKTLASVTGAATYTATYDSAKVKYTVTAEKCEGGKVSVDKTNVAWGETVTVTPKANDGYVIKGVYLNGKQMAVNDKGKYQFEMPKNNVKVTAVFEKKQFTVTATKPTNGTLTADKTNAAWGETVTVTPKANDGYVIKGVYLNGKQMAVNDKGKYQFEMPKNNVKVTAVFEKKQSSIVRVSGDNRFATAAAISKKTFTKADTVVLTYGYNYADALAGVPLASKLNAPILLSNTDSVPSETLAEIKRLGAKKVIILGGTNAISEKAEKQLKAKKLTTQRIVGDTRFSTAVEIAKKINTKPTEVFLVYGYNYADALSVSTVAAIKGAPIVYLPKDGELDADTAAYLKSIKGSVKKAYVIGGKSIISDSVKNKASNALGLKSVQRIAGDDRYLTCLKVNETFKDLFTGSIVCAATGTNFPDALAGGVYAAKNKAPLLLVNTAVDDLSKEQLSWLKAKDAKQVTVFGGTNSVSDKHAEKIAKARV